MMYKTIMPLAVLSCIINACSHQHTHEKESAEQGLEALSFTRYTGKTELFVEFKPMVAGKECSFAAHFTALGETFKPFTEGSITLTAEVKGKQLTVNANEPSAPGIFRLRLTPEGSGLGKLTFDIRTKNFTDRIIIDSVMVYSDEKTAREHQPVESRGGDITYLKEQAWKVEFANAPASKQPFTGIIKTNGQLLSAPGDEIVVTAKAAGIVLLSGNRILTGSYVNKGSDLFTITGGDLTEDNIEANYKLAKAGYEKAKSDYDRLSGLVKDKIVSEKEFTEAKLKYENAEALYKTIAKNYTTNGQNVTSPINGFIKNIPVTEGQYVEAGTPLATISKNRKLILQANVSQKYFNQLSAIRAANFKTTDNETVYSTEQLNGKVVSYGRSSEANTPFIPVLFEMDNLPAVTGQSPGLISGSVAEVFLKSAPVPDALVIPVQALIEEQGIFFVYVQTGGESFEKREIKTGGSDGINVQLLSGVNEGERIVIKGAYQIKLSTATGTLPAHGHEH